MKTTNYKSLGLTVAFQTPETVEEFDLNAKRAGACLEEATNNVIYRGSLAEFRSTLCEKVEEAYGVERKTKSTGKKDAEGNDVLTFDETEADYIDRVIATKGIQREELQALADAVASGIAFDASARERKPAAPKKLAKKYSDSAAKLIAGGKIDELNSRLSPVIGKTFTASGDGVKDIEALGWLVKEFSDEMEKRTLGGLTA